MNAAAIATLDFVDEHLYGARRMMTAYSRLDPGANAAYPLADYKKKKLGACGPDPNQLLQRLAFALQAAERSVPLLRQSGDFVRLNVRDLIWRPSDGHAGDTQSFRLEEVRKQIVEAFAGVDMFGCFRPHRYADDLCGCILGEPDAAPRGVFVFEAHFLVWGCTIPEMRRRTLDLIEKHEPVTQYPLEFTDSFAANVIPRAFLELLSVPRKQYDIKWIEGCDEFFAQAIDLDGCGEIELKEVLKNRPFSSLVFACGEGQRIIDGAQKYLPTAPIPKK